MENDLPFGGKVMILLGDFRQTCPVIRYGTRAQVVDASLVSSPLWPLFTIYRLSTPIRNAEDPEFATFVDNIGDGAGPNVPLDFIQRVDSTQQLIDYVYPAHLLTNPLLCSRRSILAPTHRQVDQYNAAVLGNIDGITRTYHAADSLKEADDVGIDFAGTVMDFVAQYTPPGLPAFTINIKTNAIYRMLRNFSLDRGLVKNVRGIVTHVGHRLIAMKIIRPSTQAGSVLDDEEVLIPRITFSHVLHSGHTLLRRQFPLAPAYATTFNSCQGLTLDQVGIDLTVPVFSHGQLYTALSRIRHRTHARIRLPDDESTTPNVTYHEILV